MGGTAALAEVGTPEKVHADDLETFGGILNYCEVKLPLGLIEAVNGKIKSIIRRARGFLNRRHGALKIMFLTDPKAFETLKPIFHT